MRVTLLILGRLVSNRSMTQNARGRISSSATSRMVLWRIANVARQIRIIASYKDAE
jgi:hypothetical protein